MDKTQTDTLPSEVSSCKSWSHFPKLIPAPKAGPSFLPPPTLHSPVQGEAFLHQFHTDLGSGPAALSNATRGGCSQALPSPSNASEGLPQQHHQSPNSGSWRVAPSSSTTHQDLGAAPSHRLDPGRAKAQESLVRSLHMSCAMENE